MICRCFRSFDLRRLTRRARETAELMVGVPDYDAYYAHMRMTHPEQPAMTRTAFFREREAARFGHGKGRFRCC